MKTCEDINFAFLYMQFCSYVCNYVWTLTITTCIPFHIYLQLRGISVLKIQHWHLNHQPVV